MSRPIPTSKPTFILSRTSSPTYHPPTRGLLPFLPSSWAPYAELTRVHKPTGIIVIYLPYLLGLLYAATIQHPPPRTVSTHTLTLALASTILRSAGCTWNDVVDCKVDQAVARCRLRPVARGAISPLTASIFFLLQMILWLAFLHTICPASLIYALPILPMVLFYPYAKRITDYPQIVLGITLALGLLPGAKIANVDLIPLYTRDPRLAAGFGALFLAYVTWTAIYDTIYAFQDIADDARSGVRSMAVRWQHRAKTLLWGLVVVQVVALGAAGWALGAGPRYYVGAVGGVAVGLGVMVRRVDLGKTEECAWWFERGILIVGCAMVEGLVAEYVGRIVVINRSNVVM